MSRSTSQPSRSRPSLWQRFKSLLIADVPEDIAICEFDCSKNQCTYGEWATCQRRINLQALSNPKQVELAQDGTGQIPCRSRSDLAQR
ncbi:MAG: hypothetical protein ACLQIB_56475 [Isosphaeraceae bacterium]